MTSRKQKQQDWAMLLSSRQREARIAKLLEAGRIRSAKEIPADALPAALELQNPKGSSFPPLFYQDMDFVCEDCGRSEMWNATQQRWYYEVAKGPVQARAIHCRTCRKKRREETLKQRELLRLHRERKAATGA